MLYIAHTTHGLAGLHISLDVLPFWENPWSYSQYAYVIVFSPYAKNAAKESVLSHPVDKKSVLNHKSSVWGHLVNVLHLFHVLRVLHVLPTNSMLLLRMLLAGWHNLCSPATWLHNCLSLVELSSPRIWSTYFFCWYVSCPFLFKR